jgi:hypothetical protein
MWKFYILIMRAIQLQSVDELQLAILPNELQLLWSSD